MSTDHLNYAMQDGAQVTCGGDEMTIELKSVGELRLPTGRLIGCDPFHSFRDEFPFQQNHTSFDRCVLPGAYPFDVCIVRFPPADPRLHPAVSGYPKELLDAMFPRNEDEELTGDQRIAFAVLRFSDRTSVQWEPVAGNGLAVDVACAAYMDLSTAEWLKSTVCAKGQFDERVLGQVQEQGAANYEHTRSWSNVICDPTHGNNLITCTTGCGDGTYPSYWGLDSSGELACVVTDFGIISSGEDS